MNKFEKISFEQWEKDWNVDYWSEPVANVLYEQIKLPKRATMYSAGYDIYAPYDIVIPPKGTVKVPTGIRVILDDDKFLAIYPRSGLGFKYKMQLYNSVGVIDADYSNSDNEGHIWAKFYNDSPDGKTITIKQGEAMCQGIIQQYFTTIDDVADGIRNGGMGSTTK
jgi:dUTP pyrophosphatase